MSEKKSIPINEEHLEAIQSQIDKERYEVVAKLPPEQQKAHAELERAVEILNGSGCVFSVVAALPNEELKFWHYHKITHTIPFTTEERAKVISRAWQIVATTARFFVRITDHFVSFHAPNQKLYYIITPSKDVDVSKQEENPDAIV